MAIKILRFQYSFSGTDDSYITISNKSQSIFNIYILFIDIIIVAYLINGPKIRLSIKLYTVINL